MLPEPDLYTQICAFENLYEAYRKARKGKRASPQVAAFEYQQEKELLLLRDELSSATWQPGAYHNFYIHEPKRRLISAAPFRDRVAHHALCNVIEPIWEKLFIADTYANRKGKGTHRAIARAHQFARRFKYVLQCDFKQFFPGIDHAILRGILAEHIPDARVMAMIERILASGIGLQTGEYEMCWFPGDDLLAANRVRGLPIGNLTSQLWGNVYLNNFDHFVRRELHCLAYVRYVDDFILFADDKRTLAEWKERILRRAAALRLTLHQPQVYPVKTGIPFLGFRLYPDHRRLKARRGYAFQRRFRHLHQQWLVGAVKRKRLDDSARSWAAHAAWGDTYHLRRALLAQFSLSSQ